MTERVSFFPLSLFIPGDLVTVLNQKIAQRNMRTFLFRVEFKRCSKFFSFRFCGKRFFAFYCCRNTTEPVMYRIELLKLTALMLSCTRYNGAAHLPIQRHYYRHKNATNLYGLCRSMPIQIKKNLDKSMYAEVCRSLVVDAESLELPTYAV